jgi:2',3'-cyclic-nucleotide 2'-phosphodiesterase
MDKGIIKIIAFGDIIGRPGREALKKIIPDIRKLYSPDIIIANGENLAHNEGITEKILNEILGYGVDFVTLGDHAFDREKEMIKIFAEEKYPIIRPANYPPGAPGRGWKIANTGKGKLAIINLMGRVFFREILDCPFRCADKAISEISKETNVIICDFHAEATSEKKAMGYHLDGRVSLVYGTHTHIPTADEQILPQKTAYITDIGMTGPKISIIGSDPKKSIKHFTSQMPFNYEVSEDAEIEANAVFAEINPEDGKVLNFERIRKFYKD